MHFFLSNQTEYVYLHRIMLFLIKKENMKNESKLFYLLRICFIFFIISILCILACRMGVHFLETGNPAVRKMQSGQSDL